MKREIRIALAGNPNSGKSTLFNNLTGLDQKISNYPGTTVDLCQGTKIVDDSISINIIDLPGFYSLFPKGEDEKVASDEMLRLAYYEQVDVVVYVADASNLRRSLMLFSQLMDLKLPIVLVLNMQDLAEAKGLKIDTAKLSEVLGISVVPITARKGKGIDKLIEVLVDKIEKTTFTFYPSNFFENSISNTIQLITNKTNVYLNLLLSFHPDIIQKEPIDFSGLENKVDYETFQTNDTLHRFKVIDELLLFCTTTTKKKSSSDLSLKIDEIVTHKYWGFLIFIAVFFLVFQALFNLAAFPMDWIEGIFMWISNLLGDVIPDGLFNKFIVQGLIPGISGILVFVPQIAILFGLLTILEDIGYMSRVSFIMDKIMRNFGLNGKSVVPLVGGMACAVGSIMAARTIENKKERLLTIFVTPLMSCSARLPVYTLLISLIVPEKNIFGIISLQGLMLLGMYLFGVIATLIVAGIVQFFVKNDVKNYFIMEMPVYRVPVWKNALAIMISKSKAFVMNAGKIILAVSVLLWILGTFGPPNKFKAIDEKYAIRLEAGDAEVETQLNAEKLEYSYLGYLGKGFEPIIKPLGFDWKIGISIISSFVAREVFVGTLSTIYGLSDADQTITLKQKMQKDKWPDGRPIYTPVVALSLMLFYAFALQCFSTIAIVKRETGGWRWPIIQFVMFSLLAYGVSFFVYQVFG